MGIKQAVQWFSNLRNTADYSLRQKIGWKRRGLSFENEPKNGLFRHLPETDRQRAEERSSYLLKTYHLPRFRDASTRDNYLENLYYLDMLEKALTESKQTLPESIDAADIGPSSWFYVQALHALLSWWSYPQQRKVKLSGYEADPYRLYSNFYSRHDHARAHIRDLMDANYFAEPFHFQPVRFDLITMLFPFVFIDDHLGWGLPTKFFRPQNMMADAWQSLKPGGILIVVNQGEKEHMAQRAMMEELGIHILTAFKHESLFYSYEHDRFVMVAAREN
jgi:SAM-dependent methyltransferase